MASTVDRLVALAKERLDLEADLDKKFSDTGVSSVDAVEFLKLVSQKFNVEITSGDFANIQTLRELADHLDSNAG